MKFDFKELLPLRHERAETILDKLREHVSNTLRANEECFIIKWAQQNPNEILNDWVMCYQPVKVDGDEMYTSFCMRKKSSLPQGENNGN